MGNVGSGIGISLGFALLLAACGGGSGGSNEPNPPPSPPPDPGAGPAACIGGSAAGFSCSGISLRARIPHIELGGTTGNDIWGWADALSGKEYALIGLTNGTAFVDVTEPENPVYLGLLPTETVESPWRDIKVHADHAYVVADQAGAHGMQVLDLRRLRGLVGPETFIADVVYNGNGLETAHNLAINEDTGFAYVVGSNTCTEGLHFVDIRTPNNPMFAGCHQGFDVHDAQCVSYNGPDADHVGKEVCFSAASDVVEIADVSLKPSPVSIQTVIYPGLGFVHQGWLTEDQRYLFIGDEFDEDLFSVPTRTVVIDVSDLDNPAYAFTYEATTASIDHNMYVLGNRLFQANYTSGLRVLEFGDLAAADINEIAFFDTFPDNGAVEFDGAWSVYPYLPSGSVIVNDISNGLFVLTLD